MFDLLIYIYIYIYTYKRARVQGTWRNPVATPHGGSTTWHPWGEAPAHPGAPKSAQDRPGGPKERLRESQERPKTDQARAKSGQEQPKSGPRRLKSDPEQPKSGPKAILEASWLVSGRFWTQNRGISLCFPILFDILRFEQIYALKTSWCSTWGILGGQERPKTSQERAKTDPRAAKSQPRAAKTGPRSAKNRPRPAT